MEFVHTPGRVHSAPDVLSHWPLVATAQGLPEGKVLHDAVV